MPFAKSTRRNDFESDSFAFQSGELEAIIKGNMGLADDNPPPFEESSHSFPDNQSEELPEDPSLRMSFAKWNPEDKRSWTCGVCTYVNEPLHLLCGVCGKAKGEDKVDESSASHQASPEPVPTAEADMGDDYFLEQLRQERHNEVLELQQSILTHAAMEVSAREQSSRDHSAPDYSRRTSFSSRGSFSSIRRSFSRQQTHFLSPKTKDIPACPTHAGAFSQTIDQERPSMKIGESSTSPASSSPVPAAPRAAVPSMRPAESAVYSTVSDAEAKEMRKILSMSQSAPCHTTTTAASSTQQIASLDHQRRMPSWDEEDNHNHANNNTEDDLLAHAMAASRALSDGMDHSEGYQGMSSSTPNHHRRGRTSPARGRMCESNVIGADRRSRDTNTSAIAVPPPTPSQAMAVDQDIVQKIAARSQIRGNNYDDLPGLTSMAQPPAAARPGAYQNRPGATPVRNTTSFSRTKEEPSNPPSRSKRSAEEEKIKKEEECRKNKPFLSLRPTPSVRANSGVALDDDMLQMIINGGCIAAEEDCQVAPFSTSAPASPKKDTADMLQKAWKSGEDVTESTKKGGRFKKAAKGLLKTFRKNKGA